MRRALLTRRATLMKTFALMLVTVFALLVASPAVALTKPTTIKLKATATAPPLFMDADGDGLALTPGESTLLSFLVLNDKKQFGKKKGAKVGEASVLSWVFAPGVELGLAAVKLPKGMIMAMGLGSLTEKFTVAVVGGTGAYRNVTGTMTGTPISLTELRLVIKLTPAGK